MSAESVLFSERGRGSGDGVQGDVQSPVNRLEQPMLKMKRSIISVLLLFFGAVLSAGLWSETLTAQPRKPNLILILTDDQGYGDVGRHGNPILKTPNLDRLHDESVRFTDFHVSPTCAPTRSALLSGRHEFKNGVSHTILERERLTLKTTTLAEALKTAGYTTGIFGKWHLGDEPARWPSRRGFDEMFVHGCGGIGQTYPGTCGDAPGNQYFDPVINHNGAFEKTRGYCTDVFFNQASQWIAAAKGRKPFFAMITPNAPHAPLVVAEQYEKMYADKLPRDKAGKDTAKFFGMIANIDENVGKLLDRLKEQGIEQQTLVIFMNDNGGTAGVRVWNAGMRAQKNTPYLGGTRAINFWRWPGTLKPAAVDRLAAHIDIFPTLAELAGAKLSAAVKTQIEGRSLAPLLRNPQADWPDRYLFTHIGRWPKGANPNDFKYAQCSVRSPRWHLVSNSREGAKRWELYDVKADPGEKTDLAAQHSEVVKAMDAAYDKWWADVLPLLDNENAPQPAVNPYHELYWKQYRGPGPNNVPPGTKPASK
jgi:arylsulfatase